MDRSPPRDFHYLHSTRGELLRRLGRTAEARDAYHLALALVHRDAERRLLQLDAQLQACNCAPDPSTLQRLVSPSIEDGQPAPALHFGDPRVMALFSCLCSFQHLFQGLTNRTLRPMVAEIIPGYTAGQMTHDLRRLRHKGLIRRIPKRQLYELTSFGRRTAVFFTKTHVRIVNPSLAELDPHLPEEIANQHPLARHWRAFEQALDQRIEQAAIAA